MNTSPKDVDYYVRIREYTRLLRSFPNNNRHVLALRASCHFSHEAWRKAAKDWEKLTKIDPDDASFWGLLGQACVHGRLPQMAIAACSRAIELDPEFEPPYMHRGWAYRQLKQWDASIADYTKAVELDYKGPRTTGHSTVYLCELYAEMREYEKLADLASEAINKNFGWGNTFDYYCGLAHGLAYMEMKQYEKTIENANAYIINSDGYNNFYIIRFIKQRAAAYKKLGQKDKAKQDFDRITAIEAKENKYHRQYKQAEKKAKRQYTDLNKKNKAAMENEKKKIEKLSEVIKNKQGDAKTYYKRALCHKKMMNYYKFLQDLNKAIFLDPERVKPYKERAWLYCMLGETEKEIADYLKLPEFHPKEEGIIRDILRRLFEETGRYDKAVEQYTWRLKKYYESYESWESHSRAEYQGPRIKKLNEECAHNAGNADFYFIRGKTYDNASMFENAIADYTKAINLRPGFLTAYFYRALAYSFLARKDQDIYDKVIADYTQVLKLDDNLACNHPEFHVALGNLYNKIGKHKKAIACFTKALSIDPECSKAYDERSKLYESLGDYKAALEDLTYWLSCRDYIDEYDLSYRGDRYVKMGEFNKAIDDYSRALEYKDTFLKAKLLEKRGKCYEALNDNKKAQADFDAAAKLRKRGAYI